MIRSAAAIRASLDQSKRVGVNDALFGSRQDYAVFKRDVLLLYRRNFDHAAAARCRSVREQQQWEAREVDGLPEWL